MGQNAPIAIALLLVLSATTAGIGAAAVSDAPAVQYESNANQTTVGIDGEANASPGEPRTASERTPRQRANDSDQPDADGDGHPSEVRVTDLSVAEDSVAPGKPIEVAIEGTAPESGGSVPISVRADDEQAYAGTMHIGEAVDGDGNVTVEPVQAVDDPEVSVECTITWTEDDGWSVECTISIEFAQAGQAGQDGNRTDIAVEVGDHEPVRTTRYAPVNGSAPADDGNSSEPVATVSDSVHLEAPADKDKIKRSIVVDSGDQRRAVGTLVVDDGGASVVEAAAGPGVEIECTITYDSDDGWSVTCTITVTFDIGSNGGEGDGDDGFQPGDDAAIRLVDGDLGGDGAGDGSGDDASDDGDDRAGDGSDDRAGDGSDNQAGNDSDDQAGDNTGVEGETSASAGAGQAQGSNQSADGSARADDDWPEPCDIIENGRINWDCLLTGPTFPQPDLPF